MPGSLGRTAIGVVVIGGVILARLVNRQATVLGFYRSGDQSTFVANDDLVYVPDTIGCEDLHYHALSDTLFTACQDELQSRHDWFPGLGNLAHPESVTTGSIHVINPNTKTSQRLRFENFNGPFVTHGIDVISDPASQDSVYLFAINHLPNPLRSTNATEEKARSQVEIFYHTLGSQTARHVRSVRHPLIRTPNDLLVTSPSTFYVTNDHFYREGGMRSLELVLPPATWTDTVHVTLSSLKGAQPEANVEATVAINSLHNNNGMGHGPKLTASTEEILIASAGSGQFHLAKVDDANFPKLIKQKTIPIDNALDNPSYFHDTHASGDNDLSGYVLAGLTTGNTLTKLHEEPDMNLAGSVHYIPRSRDGNVGEPRLIFEDTGERVNMVTTALLTPADSKTNGNREAWLWATGLLSKSVVAVRVRL